MWQLDRYVVVRGSDLSEELAKHAESVPRVVAQLPHWIAEGESAVLQQMLSESREESAGAGFSHSQDLLERLTEAFERHELIALCAEPIPGRAASHATRGALASTSPAAVFAMRVLSTRARSHDHAHLPRAHEGASKDQEGEAARKQKELDNRPFHSRPDEPTDSSNEENWIFVMHHRAEPGDLDPKLREPTELRPVLSTAHIYQAGTSNEVATAKLKADGKPLRVSVPPGMTAFEVVFDNDFGGDYKIAHKPYKNPFRDKTKKPTPEQIAKLGSIGLLSSTPRGSESESRPKPGERGK